LENINSNDEFVVLYPTGSLDHSMLLWLETHKIQTGSYEWYQKDDPYSAKLLISNYLSELNNTNQLVLYIDPDHIIRGKLTLRKPLINTLFVSSEVKPANTQPFNYYYSNISYGYKPIFHFNNSLIWGNLVTWQLILNQWMEEYTRIKDHTPIRYREEIAFNRACGSRRVVLRPVSPNIQSNFNNIVKTCSLFHYGGESRLSKLIKNCLNNSSLIDEYKNYLYKETLTDLEKWAFQELLKIIARGD
jgi:hypothetical protein